MSTRYEILDASGDVIKRIVASNSFMTMRFPEGNFRVVEELPEPEPQSKPEPPRQITMRQLIIGLATDGWITWPEAEAWADRSTLPAAVNTVIDQMPEEERPAARITAKTMSVAERDNPLLVGAAKIAEPELSEKQIEALIADAFTRWSQL